MNNGGISAMKKSLIFLLTLSLMLGLAVPFTAAATTDETTILQTVQALGIMNGDENGNMNLSASVTRAQFAKMMVAASVYKDTISATASSSPFKDVSYTHWAASYVQAAVVAGWVTGYTDGTYRPEDNVKLEEAVSAVLKMLGYTNDDFSGAFPDAQLAKYRALGLSDNISKSQGQTLSRRDCMYLFYNLMSTETTDGTVYAATLGYSVNDAGELDYSDLVRAALKGPYIVTDSSWSSDLPFSIDEATIRKNGEVSSVSDIDIYDVYYYNANLKSVWVYRNMVSGVYTAASPSTSSPTSVTVAGQSYTIATSSAAMALSDLGDYGIGDTVTLLLGMDGEIVGVFSSETVNTTRYGMVLSTETESYTNSSGVITSYLMVTMIGTDGGTYEYECGSSISTGALLKVSTSDTGVTVTRLSEKSLTGKVNAAATSLGSLDFADDVEILDTTSEGDYIITYPSRLAGMTLTSGDVRYYVLDTSGDISQLILDDVTGDLYSYGILTSVSESSSSSSSSLSASGKYSYIIDGNSGSYSVSKTFGVKTGPALFRFSGSSITNMKNLDSVKFSDLNSLYGTSSDGTEYLLSESVDIYLYSDNTYYLTSLVSVSSGYSLVGYYDKAQSDGGRIRIIIAKET